MWISQKRIRRALGAPIFALGALGLLPGCLEIGLNPQDSSEEEPGEDGEWPAGSCEAWKVSYCRAMDQCGAFGQSSDCELDVGYVQCAEDADFASCQKKIDRALKKKSCESLPRGCGPQQIADRTGPGAICQALRQEICEHSLYCGTELSLETCLASLELQAPCSEYTAVLPEAEECLRSYQRLSCGATLPSACQGILRK